MVRSSRLLKDFRVKFGDIDSGAGASDPTIVIAEDARKLNAVRVVEGHNYK